MLKYSSEVEIISIIPSKTQFDSDSLTSSKKKKNFKIHSNLKFRKFEINREKKIICNLQLGIKDNNMIQESCDSILFRFYSMIDVCLENEQRFKRKKKEKTVIYL